jgi:DNA-binding transcriptional ArsR family regulator
MMSSTVSEGLLDATFGALADPTRRAILARLARGKATVGELATPFGFALPTISRHLKVLEVARLIEKRKDASRRECQLRLEPLQQASKWIETYTAFWEGTLESLEEFAVRERTRSHRSARRLKGRR